MGTKVAEMRTGDAENANMCLSVVEGPMDGGRRGNTNALRHGVLSNCIVLPWEDPNAYAALLEAVVAEHAPVGPTEEHLVEELAGIIWRKRRLHLAEKAAYQHGLRDALQSYRHTGEAAVAHLPSPGAPWAGKAVRLSSVKTEAEWKDLKEDEAMTETALKVLKSGKSDAYERAVAALRDDTRGWWASILEGEDDWGDESDVTYTPDADGLQRFLETKVAESYAETRTELENRPFIRAQAFADAFDGLSLNILARYEVHLDRKLERVLTMLFKLKELRTA